MVAIPAVAPTRLHGDAKTKSAIPKDLYRFIYALSGACERDANVLRDGRLVDTLESQAKEIIRARRQHRSPSMGSNYSSSSLSSSSSSMRAGTPPPPPPPSSSSSSKLSKRRKLPTDKPTSVVSSSPPSNNSHIDDAASLVMARGDGSSSVIPAVKISKLERPRTLVSSSPSRIKSVDLAGSMASTVSSSSMRQYDLDADDATTLTPTARYARASSTYDYDDYPPPPRSRMSSLRRQSNNSVDDHQPNTPSTDLDDSLLHVDELRTSLRKDSCYSESSTTSSSFDRVTPKKLRFEMDALSLYEKDDDTLHLSTGSSIKNVESSLVETLQSQVDLLLSENVKALAENARLLEATQMSVCELETHVEEKRRVLQQVHQQSLQLAEIQHKLEETESRANAQSDIRREAEVAFQAELDAKTKLLTSLQEQMEAKEDEIGRLTKRVEEISGVFASKMRERESLSRSSITSSAQVIDLDEGKLEVGDEPETVRALRENNVCMDLELQKMRATLLEKDREICNLYMHLSTKKKLIEEITKKFVQHMEEAAAVAKANAAASAESAVATESVVTTSEGSETTFAKDGVRFDLDMFLFKNVVDKQRRVEELTAALGVMDREVESLESRVAEKELENTQLREKQDFLTRSLQSVNAQVVRVRAENEQLVSLNEEKQTRITGLVASLEEKERQILHLDEQVDLRQTQIDHLMEKASNSGRKSLKNSLFKPRASLGSSSVKNAPSRGSLMSFSSSRDEEDENLLRSSMMSAARVSITRKPSADSGDVRSSMDWTDIRRSSLLSSQRASVSAEKENRASLVSDSEFAPKRSSLFSRVFDDISSPINDDDDTDSFFNLNPSSPSEPRSTRASYCASEINDDEELYNELFAKA